MQTNIRERLQSVKRQRYNKIEKWSIRLKTGVRHRISGAENQRWAEACFSVLALQSFEITEAQRRTADE